MLLQKLMERGSRPEHTCLSVSAMEQNETSEYARLGVAVGGLSKGASGKSRECQHVACRCPELSLMEDFFFLAQQPKCFFRKAKTASFYPPTPQSFRTFQRVEGRNRERIRETDASRIFLFASRGGALIPATGIRSSHRESMALGPIFRFPSYPLRRRGVGTHRPSAENVTDGLVAEASGSRLLC